MGVSVKRDMLQLLYPSRFPWLTTPAATPKLTAVVMVATSLRGHKGAGHGAHVSSASFTSPTRERPQASAARSRPPCGYLHCSIIRQDSFSRHIPQ